MAPRQQIKYPLETLHPVAVARDKLTTNSVGGSPESVELGFKNPAGMVEWFWSLDRIDQRQHGQRLYRAAACLKYNSSPGSEP
jgi:hypothetical protein